MDLFYVFFVLLVVCGLRDVALMIKRVTNDVRNRPKGEMDKVGAVSIISPQYKHKTPEINSRWETKV